MKMRFIGWSRSQFASRRFVKNEDGYLMPTVIILMVIMASIAYATMLQANNSLNLSYKQSYIQMARAASKAAIDYAQEQFDNANCGNYTGTSPITLTGPSNTRYKVTMEAAVQNTSDDFEKKVVGTGKVYLPKTSASALYVQDIRSEIVRTYAVCKTPDNFSPLIWLDSNITASLKKTGTVTTTLTPLNTSGIVSGSTGDTLKERADNGSQTAGSWSSTFFDMNSCTNSEFTLAICGSNATKYLNLGLIYSNVDVPKNATITSANLTLNCHVPSGSGGALTDTIYGFYKSAANPHPDLFTSNGSNQLKTPLATSTLHTSATAPASLNNCAPGNHPVFNVTNVVQEIINNPTWDPAADGGRMGFLLTRTSGSGSHKFDKGSNQLSIAYSTTTVNQANSGDSLSEWDDISGNNLNAKFTYGNAPTRVDNQINGKPIVRFNNGALLSTLSPALSGKREMTIMAVVKANFGTSSSNGRAISGTSSSASNDTTSGSSIIPLSRYSNNNGLASIYSGATGGTYQTNFSCNTSCNSTPYLYVSTFQIDTGTKVNAFLRGSGVAVAEKDGLSPAGSPYTFSIDQLYFGGTRTSAMPGNGGSYFNGDYAELVVYPQALSCHQTEDLEEYFRAKWNLLPAGTWVDNCPSDNVPTL